MRQTDKFVFFFGKEDVFSNWHPAGFEYKGVNFNCVEQFMMYSKAMLFDDKEAAQKILSANDPKTQKAIGRTVRGFDEATWDAKCTSIVVVGCREKFRQNLSCYKALVQTGNKTLVEASPYDRIWGIGLGQNDPSAEYPEKWKGLNKLGKALEVTRGILLGLEVDQALNTVEIKTNEGVEMLNADSDLISALQSRIRKDFKNKFDVSEITQNMRDGYINEGISPVVGLEKDAYLAIEARSMMFGDAVSVAKAALIEGVVGVNERLKAMREISVDVLSPELSKMWAEVDALDYGKILMSADRAEDAALSMAENMRSNPDYAEVMNEKSLAASIAVIDRRNQDRILAKELRKSAEVNDLNAEAVLQAEAAVKIVEHLKTEVRESGLDIVVDPYDDIVDKAAESLGSKGVMGVVRDANKESGSYIGNVVDKNEKFALIDIGRNNLVVVPSTISNGELDIGKRVSLKFQNGIARDVSQAQSRVQEQGLER